MASDDPADPTGRRRRSWLGALAAAVLVAAGATGIVLLTRHTGAGTDPVAQVTVTATPSVSPTSGGTAGPGVVVLGPTEQPRSAIPWGQVGPGWSAASWSPRRRGDVGDPLPRQPDRQRATSSGHPEYRRVRHHVRRSPSSHCRPTSRRRCWSGTSPPGRHARSPSASRRRDLHPSRTARPCSPPTPRAAPHADAATRARRVGTGHLPGRHRHRVDDPGRPRPRRRHHLRARGLRQRDGHR